jgi:hypothetical protein
LVELFTSQGCSSCPPAESWLNGEGMALFQKGQIIPLAFHVDYWDYLGWKDPFSQSDFTAHQRLYAAAFKDDSIYTPEMVVGGRTGFVGSDGGKAEREIGQAQNRPASLEFGFSAHRTAKGIRLKLSVGSLKPGWKVFAAVFENGRVTKVERGENAGRTLKENFVVRSLVELNPKGPAVILHPAPSDGDYPLGVVVFVQDMATMEVLAAKCVFPLSREAD